MINHYTASFFHKVRFFSESSEHSFASCLPSSHSTLCYVYLPRDFYYENYMDANISQCITSVKRLRKDEVGGCIVQRAQPMYDTHPMRARAM